MEKIELVICCGTACYMLGADKLLKIENELPSGLREHVNINASPCLELCVSDKIGGAPFVKINGKIMSQATVEKVVDKIKALAAEDAND